MNFTKGEWISKYDHALGRRYIMSGTKLICEIDANDEAKGNTDLIASAPDMFAALSLIEIGYAMGNVKLSQPRVKAIRDALAKAQGR